MLKILLTFVSIAFFCVALETPFSHSQAQSAGDNEQSQQKSNNNEFNFGSNEQQSGGNLDFDDHREGYEHITPFQIDQPSSQQ